MCLHVVMYLHAVKWVDVCAHVNVLQNISNLGFWVTHACLVFHNVEYCSVGYCQTVGEKKHDRLKSCSFESVVFSTQAFPLWRAVLVISQHSIERVIGKSGYRKQHLGPGWQTLSDAGAVQMPVGATTYCFGDDITLLGVCRFQSLIFGLVLFVSWLEAIIWFFILFWVGVNVL